MIFREWEDLPKEMQIPAIRPYYDSLKKKQTSLVLKRIFDVVVSAFMLLILSPVFLVLAIMIKLDSKGPVIFKQERVTAFGERFMICKFRSMKVDQGKNAQLTVGDDDRITKVGHMIRDKRLDELPQLINVLKGEMSFVGTRPEVPKYVEQYKPKMLATLLMPAGITSMASIEYKEESEELAGAEDPAKYYVDVILPKKMKINLRELKRFSVMRDLFTMIKTVLAVF